MKDHADLELSLRRRDPTHYSIDLIFKQPGSEVDTRPLNRHDVSVMFDLERLRETSLDPAIYGQRLSAMLFSNEALSSALAQCRAAAQSQDHSLRLCIAIAPDIPELHTIRWETLCDPETAQPLALSEQLTLTRTLGSADWQPVMLRAKGDLRALVVIAAPVGLERYRLGPISVADERKAAEAGLGSISTTVLDAPGQTSLPAITAELRNGYDILYLVAHGNLLKDCEPGLYLDDGQGQVAYTSGADLVARLADLPARPRLIFLASCQSAGDGGHNALSALGPCLAAAGIPAVIAMQGPLSMETNATLVPEFFRELQRDGRIDRALAAARQKVINRHDWWAPALFTRLRSGRIWYEPGFADSQRGSGDEKWDALLASIRDEECTLIIGSDFPEGFLGSRRDLARNLAEQSHYPLDPHDREGLPQVSQYIAVRQSVTLLRTAIMRQYAGEIQRRRQGRLTVEDIADLKKLNTKALLSRVSQLLSDAWQQWPSASIERYGEIAKLPIPLYISADPSDLLIGALRAEGKQPEEMFCPWNKATREESSVYITDPSYDPTPQRPLVYRLFGSYQKPDTLVLTEDQHFDYLIGVTQNKALIPARVREGLADKALLFLGFCTDDWSFRVFFRSLVSQEGGERRKNHAHISAQIAPGEERNLSPALAQRYLEEYFGKGPDISINVYWGSTDDFIHDLVGKL